MEASHFFQITLTAIGFLLTAILSILAFFIKKWIESVDNLANEFSTLREDFILQRSTHNNFEERCVNHHKYVDKSFEDLQEQVADNTHRIEKNSQDIEVLKEKARKRG